MSVLGLQLKSKTLHREHDTLLVVPGGLHRTSSSIKIEMFIITLR